MAAQKNQTNGQILKNILDELKNMNTRVITLENWKIADDAARAAVDAYKRDEKKTTPSSDNLINKELLKALGLALTALVGIVAFLKATK